MAKVERKDEVRSMYVVPASDQLPAESNPCAVMPGYRWVRAFAPGASDIAPPWTGKWLLNLSCPYVANSWGLIRDATIAGKLGIGAKISTQWGMVNDPVKKWKQHIVCVYTYDWHDRADVLRVVSAMRDIGVIKSVNMTYKPDVFTEAGMYKGNAPGDVAIYSSKAPYESLIVNDDNYAVADSLFVILPDGTRTHLLSVNND